MALAVLASQALRCKSSSVAKLLASLGVYERLADVLVATGERGGGRGECACLQLPVYWYSLQLQLQLCTHMLACDGLQLPATACNCRCVRTCGDLPAQVFECMQGCHSLVDNWVCAG